jgi:D-glycero-alpha-D-manno-heptose-7-phosphate kinase
MATRRKEAPREFHITASAPCRSDLAGGTLDLWPLYLFHPGARTLNFALNILTRCTIQPLKGKRIRLRSLDTNREDNFPNLAALLATRRYRHSIAAYLVRFFQPDQGFILETHSEAPAGAGISGSSALMIATTAALARFCERKFSREEIRLLAQNVEAQIIRVPTGCQDYYPALYGGASAIFLDPAGIRREAIAVAPEEIEARFVLAYTGAPRQSGINNWEVFKAHVNGDHHVFRNFEEIARIAREMHPALQTGKWAEVACLLREEWKLRRTNVPGITTAFIDELIGIARKHGGVAAKVCGAGGGGCVLFMVQEGSRSRVEQALALANAQILPLEVARTGLRLEPHAR